MKVTIRNLIDRRGNKYPYAVAKVNTKDNIEVNPGDYSFNEDLEIFQANQSTCVWCEWKVIGKIGESVSVREGEEVDIYFKCKAQEKCNYPFCGSDCNGNYGFYVAGRECRGY